MQTALVRKSTREDSGSGATTDRAPSMKVINAPVRAQPLPPADGAASPRRPLTEKECN
ncbi:hypothetical protein [Streptomyces sp. SAS_260]|uniref:hypothetical protein n=1 Tax=Streptomyces sp. SAS_260 TaxID=3412751 RepID=UPI00403D1655